MAEPTSPTSHRPRNPGDRPLTDPRAAALHILRHLETGDATLDRMLDAAAPRIAGLSHRDRALFNQLVHGVLRWRGRLDAVAECYADRGLKKLSPTMINILRLGLFQILFMDRIPPSAAVNTAVELARAQRAGRAAGFVNALLRNVLRDPDRFRLPDPTRSPMAHIAAEKSFPPWLISRWVDRLGVAETRRRCDAMNVIPPITLRCNTLRNSVAELIGALERQADSTAVIETVPGAIDLIGPRCPIVEMPAFAEGRFAVQDAAAQLVSLMLAPRPGETVLDACAGLGGKTTHLAQIMGNRGVIAALDNAPAKLLSLSRDARRQGITIIEPRQADLNQPVQTDAAAPFDRILLDAPCTGLGVLRRNPDAKWSSTKKDIARFAHRQLRFLEHVAPLVKPGGVIVFAVCSLEPEENEGVITRFLKIHSNFAISEKQSLEEKSVLPFLDKNGFLRTEPHSHHMDGFFAARIQRRC